MQQPASVANTEKPQPPRPESRSDSYARADALLREHRQQQQQLTPVNTAINHLEQKQAITQDFGRNVQPESRNRVVAYQTCSRTIVSSNDRSADHVDAGLLAMVDQKSTSQNNADPLVSLIQSLAEISPVRSTPTVTNKTENDHPAATTQSTSSNVANAATNCSPNQSPKAWQNCAQVCPGCEAYSCEDPNLRLAVSLAQYFFFILFVLFIALTCACTRFVECVECTSLC